MDNLKRPYDEKTIEKFETQVGLASQLLFGLDEELSQPELGEFSQVGGSPVPGITLHCILRGHTNRISCVAWSPDGRSLASSSADNTIRIWKWDLGEAVAVLEAHLGDIRNVVWSPDGRMLASSSYMNDSLILLWDTTTNRPIKILKGHHRWVNGMAFSPDGQMLASGSLDYTVHLWDVVKGIDKYTIGFGEPIGNVNWLLDDAVIGVEICSEKERKYCLLNVLNQEILQELKFGTGTEDLLPSVSPDKQYLAIINHGSIEIWDIKTWQQRNILEGHTSSIVSTSFSSDGRLLASKSIDGTVRIWRCDTFEPVALLHETCRRTFWAGRLAFHPSDPTVLATLGEADNIIRVWDLDIDRLLNSKPTTESVRYTTAKLVLVGDSGVGKTGLGWRLAYGDFKEHASTHGQQFWVISDLGTKRADGTECEAVLWDLAGQHVYRPIHAIFLDNVDLALVLFDPANRQDPLKGAEFWLEQLSGKGNLPSAVLVGARVDRGTSVLSNDELRQFCQRHGISGGYVSTSAKSGEGIAQLTAILKTQIPWDEMTTTVTTVTFKRIKGSVLARKEQPNGKTVLIRPPELHQLLHASDPEWQFTNAEMMTAVKHLENHGYVTILRSSSGQESILLAPELLVDLASSIVLQADKHPRELGAVSETELLRGSYPFFELENLQLWEQYILLDAAVMRFLSHNICFREVLGNEMLLIFPGMIKQKRPLLDELEVEDDVSYVVQGAVENIYPALVVLLGYTQTFTRINHWQNQAQYEMGKGQIGGFRLVEDREGEIELVLYYSAAMPEFGRAMFQGLFEKFLYQRDVVVRRFPTVFCPNSHRQERAIVMKRLRESKQFIFCDECGDKVFLPEIEKPLMFGAKDVRWIQREEALARLRSLYETYLVNVKGFRRDREAPRCYISHVSKQDEWAEQLASDLRDAGVYVLEECAHITEQDFIIIVCSPDYKQAWKRRAKSVAVEFDIIRAHLQQNATHWSTIIPIVLEGDMESACPREFHGCQPGDFHDQMHYAIDLFDLVLTLYVISFNHPAFDPLRKSLRQRWEQTLAGFIDTRREIKPVEEIIKLRAELAAENRQQQRNLLKIKQQRLRTLERQAASYGLACPAHIIVEIEQLREEIKKLTG